MNGEIFLAYLWEAPRLFWSLTVIVVFSICCHEYMHARVALFEGDSTAADRGHLTLNPLRQMGVWSLITFALLGIAWGQVPVNPGVMRRRHSHALVAFAGPLTNLALFLGFGILCVLAVRLRPEQSFAAEMLFYGSTVNLLLFLLNILPIPGFDGWAILADFLPRVKRIQSEWVRGTFFVVVMLLFINFKWIMLFCFFAAESWGNAFNDLLTLAGWSM